MHARDLTKRQILDRVDLVALISEHVTLKRRGQRWVGLCPFHSEKTPSFTVSPERGFFKCFGCGKGGDVFTFVQLREGVEFGEALRILADRAGVELSDRSNEPAPGPGRAELAKVNGWVAEFFRARLLDPRVGASVRDYVRTRNLSDQTAARFGLGAAPEGGPGLAGAARKAGFDVSVLIEADLLRRSERGDVYETFRNRLMFPIRDATRRVVGFGGRTLGDDPAKYLNTRQNALFEKGRVLFGIDLAREAIVSGGRAVVVEGYTDCLAAHQAGFCETVATLGTALTEAQVDLLRRYGEQIILLFDSDEAGEAAADRAIHVALPRCVTVRLARVPEGKDPCDFLVAAGPGAFSDLLNGAVDALEFKWSQARRRFLDDGSEVRRREAVVDFLRVVAEAADNGAFDAIQRGRLVIRVAHLLGASRDDVERMMRRFRSRSATARLPSPAAPGAGSEDAVPVCEEQAAWRHVLEVLLNEPALAREFAFEQSLERIAAARDRRIAEVLVALLREKGRFVLADVLEKVNDPADMERVMHLAHRGAARGNYAATLAVAVERLNRAAQNSVWEKNRGCVAPADRSGASEDQGRNSLAELTNLARRYRGFSPRRLIRRMP